MFIFEQQNTKICRTGGKNQNQGGDLQQQIHQQASNQHTYLYTYTYLHTKSKA